MRMGRVVRSRELMAPLLQWGNDSSQEQGFKNMTFGISQKELTDITQ